MIGFLIFQTFWKFPIGNLENWLGGLDFIGNWMEIMTAVLIGNFMWNLKMGNIKIKSKNFKLF
jgi:hypothetical protein